jgi:hypothetical protein
MTIETIAIVGFVFALPTIAPMLHERRMDVLHGPYVEQLEQLDREKKPILAPIIANRFRWRVRNRIYLTSIIAC